MHKLGKWRFSKNCNARHYHTIATLARCATVDVTSYILCQTQRIDQRPTTDDDVEKEIIDRELSTKQAVPS